MPGVVEEYVNHLKEEAANQQSEMEGEARAEREGLHIDQFHARYESPSLDASEYVHNLFAEESESLVEKQLRTVDRQFPDATEVEKLRITEDRLGVGHRASERIQNAYQDLSETIQREQPQQRETQTIRGPRVRM